MPLVGGLVLLAQILFAVHVVRTGRPYYWIYLIVFVPVLGMAVYAVCEFLPEMMNSRRSRSAAAGVVGVLDPGRALREAVRAVEMTPTAKNKATLAEQYLLAGRAGEAVALYRETLTGIHATDPGMMLGLARALHAEGDAAGTEQVLEELRAANPRYNSPEGHLLYARCLKEQNKTAAALKEYAALVNYYPGQEARVRYALLLETCDRQAEARRLYDEVIQAIDYGPRHQYREQREWYELAKRQRGA